MDVAQLQRRWLDYLSTLFNEGFLDAQFSQLQSLQDESNPNFVCEVVTVFFDDSERLLNELTRVLDQQVVDFKRVDPHVHQLKGSSASIGAQRVKNACIAFKGYCEEGNREGCITCLHQVKQEYLLVKNACIAFKGYCEEGNREGCITCLHQVKQEYLLVKNKLQTLFRLEHQILAAGGSPPLM